MTRVTKMFICISMTIFNLLTSTLMAGSDSKKPCLKEVPFSTVPEEMKTQLRDYISEHDRQFQEIKERLDEYILEHANPPPEYTPLGGPPETVFLVRNSYFVCFSGRRMNTAYTYILWWNKKLYEIIVDKNSSLEKLNMEDGIPVVRVESYTGC